jgi:hypothetical protein
MTMTAAHTDPEKTLQKNGERVLAALFRLLQAVRLHQNNNSTVTRAAKVLIQALNLFAHEASLTLHTTGNGFYLQGEKLRYRKETANLIEHALAYFEARQLPGLVFTIDPAALTSSAVLALAKLLNQAEGSEEPATWFEAQLDHHQLHWVEVIGQTEDAGPPQIETPQSRVPANETATASREQQARVASGKQSYASAYAALQEVSAKVSQGRPAGLRKASRGAEDGGPAHRRPLRLGGPEHHPEL